MSSIFMAAIIAAIATSSSAIMRNMGIMSITSFLLPAEGVKRFAKTLALIKRVQNH
jgi:hypothetical protein